MKNNQSKQGHTHFLTREANEDERDNNGTESTMQQIMMVALVEESFGTSQSPVQNIRDKAKSVDVGQNAGQSHQASVPLIMSGARSNNPTGQQVCPRIHVSLNSQRVILFLACTARG